MESVVFFACFQSPGGKHDRISFIKDLDIYNSQQDFINWIQAERIKINEEYGECAVISCNIIR